MSGGRFDYNQHRISEIREYIEDEIRKSGKEIPLSEQWHDEEWLQKYPEDRFYIKYKPETIRVFNEAIRVLELSYVYAQRIDWFLSGDDGEETFHKRLKEELAKLNK